MDREPAEGRVQRLTVVIEGGPDSDPTELAHLTGQLRRSLLELDVEDVQLPRDAGVPPGAKASDAVAIGTLIVTLAPPATHALIRLLQGWRKGRAVAAVKVTLGGDSLELTNASQDEVDRLTTAFINRHAVR